MDEKDAEKVHALLKNITLESGYKSSHDIHADFPKQFVEAIIEMKQQQNNNNPNLHNYKKEV